MNNYYQTEKDGYLISTNPALLNRKVIHHYLAVESYWAKDIPLAIVEQAIARSVCFGVYNHTAQIGFARLITDKTTFAYLADVFILPEYRGKGLSKWLMDVIHTHPELQTIRSWMLTTSDAHGLYHKYGYEIHPTPQKLMRRYNSDTYHRS